MLQVKKFSSSEEVIAELNSILKVKANRKEKVLKSQRSVEKTFEGDYVE